MGYPSQQEVVVVVDDDDFIRDSYGDVLRTLGYTVLIAENGDHALQVMTEYSAPIHLVISDINMPEMDGLEFVGMLRAAYPNMPALFVSGQSSQYLVDNRERIPEGVHFLAKPVTMGQLANRVRQILDETSGPTSTQENLE
jgi:DNA-binding NtrC family response regulator